MKIKAILKSALILLGAVVPLYISIFALNEVSISLEELSPFLDAPKITDEKDFEGIDNQIVWISGVLVPVETSSVLTAPLSKKMCLYYHYEKQWEDEGDEDTSPSWVVEEAEINSTDVVLMTGRQQTRIKADRFVLTRMGPESEYEDKIDEIKYRFFEYLIPLENHVSVIGKLENGELGPTERGILICLSSFDNLVPEFKSGVAVSLFFIVLGFILGSGLIGIVFAMFLHGRIPFPTAPDFIFYSGAACYIWMITGGVMWSLAGITIVDKIAPIIVTAVIYGGVLLPLLIFYACREKKSPAALLFIPAIGLAVLSAFFYYAALFTIGNWLLPLCAAIALSLGAVSMIVLCRWIAGRQPV